MGGLLYQKTGFRPYDFKFNRADNRQNLTVGGVGLSNPKVGSFGLTGVNIQNEGSNIPTFSPTGEFTGPKDVNINVYEADYKSPNYKGLLTKPLSRANTNDYEKKKEFDVALNDKFLFENI